MHTEWADQLSDYIDDDLTPDERRAVEAHVASCVECARLLDDLRANVDRARTLPATIPERDLWEGIEARLAAPAMAAPPRRFTFTMPQLLAASVLLALVSGWGALRLVRPTASISESAGAGQEPGTSVASPSMVVNATDAGAGTAANLASLALDDAAYDRAVSDLEGALMRDRARLDPATIAVVEDNLSVIDQAVREARQALREDPANAYLNGHFTQTRQRKLDLLRQAAALAMETN